MSAVLSAASDRDAWLAARREVITATDIAAIVGIHPYRSAHQVFLDKKGMELEKGQSEPMYWGTVLEAQIGAWYAEHHDVKMEPGYFVRAESDPFGATPDFLIGSDELLEVKVAGINAARAFGDPGSDRVPDQYHVQVTWQMLVTGRRKARLAVLLPTLHVNVYEIPWDADLARHLAFHGRKFWGEYILADNPPPLSGHKPDSEYLKERFPTDNGAVVAASPAIEELIAELGWLRKELGEKELRKDEIENQIKAFMGEATFLESIEGKFSWKACEKDVVDWKAVRAEAPDLIEKHRSVRTERRFLTPWRSNKA